MPCRKCKIIVREQLRCAHLHVYYGDLAGLIEMLGTTLESEPLDPETAPETRQPGRKKPDVINV